MTKRTKWLFAIVFTLTTSLSTIGSPAENTSAAGDEWPQWRGPSRDGQFHGKAWPADLSNLKLSWQVAIGKGYSGPVVGAERVYVTETGEESNEMVRALDRRTGREVWRARWPGSIRVPFFARRNGSWIKSTPSLDNGDLYVCGMEGVLVRLDARSGRETWRIDLPERYKASRPEFGFVTSPLVTEDAIYVQGGRSLLKLDKESGETIWRSLVEGQLGMTGGAFSSPVLAELEGVEQLVVQTRQELAGVDPTNGDVLWRRQIPSFRGMNILTPTVIGNRVFTSTYRGNSHLLEIRREGESYSVQELWKGKAQGYMSSPVTVGGKIYFHLQNKRAVCLDAASGEECWRTSERFGDYWSLTVQDDRILALDSNGELILFRAAPGGFDLIDRKAVDPGETWGHLAIVEGQVFVRGLEAIAAYSWE